MTNDRQSADLGSPRTSTFVSWWTDDLPPMNGGLRFIFYGGLLYLALTRWSPLAVASAFAETKPELQTPVYLFRLAFLGQPPVALVWGCSVVCLVSWVCATAGFLTAPSMIATAATATFLHGVGYGMNEAHGWLLPVYSMIFLCCSRCDDSWSIDAVIRRRWPSWPHAFRRRTALSTSGFSRKLVALAAVHTMFAGGIAKLMDGGFQWADGRSLQSYILLTPLVYDQPPRFERVASLVASRLWLCALLALGTLALELGSPVALFSRRGRHAVVVAAILFHVGIFWTMLPDFSAQAWCYVLIVDWALLLGSRRAPRPGRSGTPVIRQTVMASTSATALAGLLIAVIVFRVEEWPLTRVPMYSSYVSDLWVSDVAMADFDDAEGMARLVDLNQRGRLPWATRMMFWPHADVVLSGSGGTTSIRKAMTVEPPSRHQWTFLIQDLVLQEFARKLNGWYDAGAVPLDSAAILGIVASRAAAQGVPINDYETVEFVYRLKDGSVRLFSIPVERGVR